jgi:hypothetical protein
MKKNIEGLAHWISISCMAGGVAAVIAGQTVLEPALEGNVGLVSLLYWGVTSALVILTTAFAYLALSGARQRLRAATSEASRLPSPASPVSRSLAPAQEFLVSA